MNPTVTSAELQTLLPGGCCLVDVREPIEHAGEHVSGAKLIPLGQIEQRTSEIDRSVPLVVMCRSGKRGDQAMEKLRTAGFSNVRNLEGGILAWKAAGLPVSRTAKKLLPLMQQVQVTIGLGVLTGVILSLTVHPRWVILSGIFGAGLTFAGATGWCGLAILMSKMPWNRAAGQTACASGSCAPAR